MLKATLTHPHDSSPRSRSQRNRSPILQAPTLHRRSLTQHRPTLAREGVKAGCVRNVSPLRSGRSRRSRNERSWHWTQALLTPAEEPRDRHVTAIRRRSLVSEVLQPTSMAASAWGDVIPRFHGGRHRPGRDRPRCRQLNRFPRAPQSRSRGGMRFWLRCHLFLHYSLHYSTRLLLRDLGASGLCTCAGSGLWKHRLAARSRTGEGTADQQEQSRQRVSPCHPCIHVFMRQCASVIVAECCLNSPELCSTRRDSRSRPLSPPTLQRGAVASPVTYGDLGCRPRPVGTVIGARMLFAPDL
jgi:hypothetical protein